MLFSRFSALSTAQAIACTMACFRAAQHPTCGRVAEICCEEKVEVERSQHTHNVEARHCDFGWKSKKIKDEHPDADMVFW